MFVVTAGTSVLPLHLSPKVGLRCGSENKTMRVTLDYQPAHSREIAGGTVELPSLLDITFDWGKVINEEATTTVGVNQEITATLADEPARLVAIMGIVRNPASWEVVARLVGPFLFDEGGRRAFAVQHHHLEIEIDAKTLEPHEPIWANLLEAARDGTLRVLPRRPTDLEDEFFELVASDPNFFSDGIRLLRELYGDEAVDRALPDRSDE